MSGRDGGKAIGRWLAMAGVALAAGTSGAAETRVALVIGNAAYHHAPALANPVNAAADIGATLSRLGFAVTRIENADQAILRRALQEFARAASASAAAVVFYAGHGIEVDQRNFLVPVDARLLSDRDVEFETVPLELVSRAVAGAAKLRLVILDACRENPFAVTMQRAGATRAIGRGLARVEPAGATLIAYAAREGTVAADGEGRNSPYSRALLAHLEEPGLELGLMFRKVRDAVVAATGGQQEPFVYGSLPSRGMYLAATPAPDPAPATAARPPPGQAASHPDAHRLTAEQLATERVFWESVKDSGRGERIQAYLDRYPGGTYETLARDLLQELQMAAAAAEASAPPPPDGPDPAAAEAGLGLERADRRQIQAGLAALGFDPGPADGLFGRGTRRAIGRWQAAQGGAATGFLDAAAAKTLLAAAPAPQEPAADLRMEAERAYWEDIRDSDDPADLEAYLAAYPGGAYALLAQRRRDRLVAQDDAALADARSGGTAAAFERYLRRYPAGRHVAVARAEAERLRVALAPGRVFRDCDFCPEMVVVPAGSFKMGSPASERGRSDHEGPVHNVTIAKPFAVDKHEVARGEFRQFVEDAGHAMPSACYRYGAEWEVREGRDWLQPEFPQTDRHPVVCVRWADAQAYVRWLSRETGERYRLLSEAEWEYAARAGSEAMYFRGDSIYGHANCAGCFSGSGIDKGTVPVGSFPPTAFGLHDMHGNVLEWVEDCWNDSYIGAPTDGGAWTSDSCVGRVSRGGSWRGMDLGARSASRSGGSPGWLTNTFGFRVAKTLIL